MRKGTERRPLSPAAVHEISQRAMGFGSSFPLIVAHASAHAALNGAGNLCTFRRAKLLVSVRMRCKVIAPFCGGDARLFARQPLFAICNGACVISGSDPCQPAAACPLLLAAALLAACARADRRVSRGSRADHFRAVGNLATGGHLATGRRVRGGVFS